MCNGGRLVAHFVAGTGVQPDLPADLQEHLTTTMDGLWVVWAYKLARQAGDLFIPLTGRSGYPADARAECRSWGASGTHDAPHPECTCGFHALSSRELPGLPAREGDLVTLTVALSGRVLGFEWARGGVLWRAERQTVIAVKRPARSDLVEEVRGRRRYPDDPDGRLAVVPVASPRDSGPVRLNLPACPAVLPVRHDDAGWCLEPGPAGHSPAALVLA
jgi:hypothetical protein